MMLNNAEKQNTLQEHHEILPNHKILIQFYNGYLWNIFIITVRNSSCGKVMFSQACVKNSVHSGGVCRQTTHGQTSPPRRPLQQTVHILLEWILGLQCLFKYYYVYL